MKVQIRRCDDASCREFGRRVGAEVEAAVAPPFWTVTWDLFAWMGQRRFSRHWSVPQIRSELLDRFSLTVSDDWIEHYLREYQVIVAGRESDLGRMKGEYADVEDVILTIDGLQPEKGHETLYVVRELRKQRVWFAAPLLSSATPEVYQLFVRAKEIAEALGKPVRGWMSDKQQAFVTCIGELFPGVAHRYCNNHFLRDVAKPILEKDSHAKVQMRRKVRGLREIEKRMLADARAQEHVESAAPKVSMGPADKAAPVIHDANSPEVFDASSVQREVVLDYCGAVRGILNDDQGGPLKPPGVRMDAALGEVQDSIERLVAAKKGGPANARKRTARRTPLASSR